jgi:hypothetical protein
MCSAEEDEKCLRSGVLTHPSKGFKMTFRSAIACPANLSSCPAGLVAALQYILMMSGWDLPPQIIDARLGMFYGFAISAISSSLYQRRSKERPNHAIPRH